MSDQNRWLLPEGVDELLPPEAWNVEALRRSMLDTFASYGYELVTPPLIEYLESLLTGTGNDLDLQTFKVTDQLTGRLMGVRADITPQVARIDSHLLKREGLSRLCYVDTVLHTRPEHSMTNRSPIQIGCELFGEKAQSADIEIISLMLATLALAGIEQIHIDLAHVGIYRGLVEQSKLSRTEQAELFDSLSRKSIPDMDALAARVENDADIVRVIRDIAELSGGANALSELRKNIESLSTDNLDQVIAAIDELDSVQRMITERFPNVHIGFDFCELRGYNYHTGVMFAAYTPSFGYALAKGGRYDDIGKDFGQSRAATGFSADLKTLSRVAQATQVSKEKILAPQGDSLELLRKIQELRQSNVVIQQLSAADDSSHGCSKRLILRDGSWVVEPL